MTPVVTVVLPTPEWVLAMTSRVPSRFTVHHHCSASAGDGRRHPSGVTRMMTLLRWCTASSSRGVCPLVHRS